MPSPHSESDTRPRCPSPYAPLQRGQGVRQYLSSSIQNNFKPTDLTHYYEQLILDLMHNTTCTPFLVAGNYTCRVE